MSIYLYSSRECMLEGWTQNLREQYPNLKIAGAESSKFRTLTLQEEADLNTRITVARADITSVGLGCPRQEVFAYEHANGLGLPGPAIGAAFDFHTGLSRWMQDRGMEWLSRLWVEPKWLWRRYLYLNPLNCLMITAQKLGTLKAHKEQKIEPAEATWYG